MHEHNVIFTRLYRPKKFIVDAVEFEGESNAKAIVDWITTCGTDALWTRATPPWVSEDQQEVLSAIPERIYLDPLGRDPAHANVGDYILRNPEGKFVAVLAEDFKRTFEEV